MVFEPDNPSLRNSLYSLASVGGVLLGFFILASAYGHFAGVWPAIDNEAGVSGYNRFALLLPGLILAITGLIDIGLCRVLWIGMRWALQLALACNVLTSMYLAYLLLSQSVPGHPIAFFLALVLSYVVLLGAIRVGLIWPAAGGGVGPLNSL